MHMVFVIEFMVVNSWITALMLELIHAPKPDFLEGLRLVVTKPTMCATPEI